MYVLVLEECKIIVSSIFRVLFYIKKKSVLRLEEVVVGGDYGDVLCVGGFDFFIRM